MTTHAVRVAVLIDWQNTYRAARRAFGMEEMPNEYGNFSPLQLARILATGNGRGSEGKLGRIEIHRGLPSSSRDPIGYAANRRQSQAWMKESPELVIPKVRPLRYPSDSREPPVEKGIDVQLALSAVELALVGEYEVVVIFSHDTDLVPAIEMITRITGKSHVETAAWRSPTHNSRLRSKPEVFHHAISEDVFRRVQTLTNYAQSATAKSR